MPRVVRCNAWPRMCARRSVPFTLIRYSARGSTPTVDWTQQSRRRASLAGLPRSRTESSREYRLRTVCRPAHVPPGGSREERRQTSEGGIGRALERDGRLWTCRGSAGLAASHGFWGAPGAMLLGGDGSRLLPGGRGEAATRCYSAHAPPASHFSTKN